MLVDEYVDNCVIYVNCLKQTEDTYNDWIDAGRWALDGCPAAGRKGIAWIAAISELQVHFLINM